jgi:hypothetical protein
MPELYESGGVLYAVQSTYALPDSAWCFELSEAAPAPASWADIPGAVSHLPGPAFFVAVVPDEDPSTIPTVHVRGGEHAVPYEVIAWFLGKVAVEVERARQGFTALRAE